VINAADYGMPQRRRRVFLYAYHVSHPEYPSAQSLAWLLKDAILAKAFPCKDASSASSWHLTGTLDQIMASFNMGNAMKRPFLNAGLIQGRRIFTCKVAANYTGMRQTVKDILIPSHRVPASFYIPQKDIPRWKMVKGAKQKMRINKSTGKAYIFAEGSIPFPDAIDKPSRTIITKEGGGYATREKHSIRDESGHIRRLVSVELERLNMFPDNYTDGLSENKRAFLMGNALVVGVINRTGRAIKACAG
jgi:DNA (cytosine-5)-methyltransferase 1